MICGSSPGVNLAQVVKARVRSLAFEDLGRWKVTDGASLVAQFAKNLCAVQEILIQSLGWEDPLEKGMATHSSILAWRIPWTEEPGRLQSMGSQRVRHNLVTNQPLPPPMSR